MTTYSAWPTDGDLYSFITLTLGLTLASSGVLAGLTSAAVNEFEMLTGRTPFLSATSASSGYFDPPGAMSHSFQYPWKGGGKILELDSGYTQIDAVVTGHTVDNTGQVLDITRQCRFLPLNYADKNLPIDAIEFPFPIWGSSSSVVIVGKRGYSSTIPADVWQAVLARASSRFAPQLTILISGGASELSEADVKVKFGGSSGSYFIQAQATQWDQQFDSVVNRYKTMRIFV